MKIPQDIVMQLDSSGNWVLYNVFTHTTLAVDCAAMQVLSSVAQGQEIDAVQKKFAGSIFKTWEIGLFSNYAGLLADPTQRIRTNDKWPQVKEMDISSFICLLKENCILVDNEKEYALSLGLKQSLLDKKNHGNFHQQLGQHLWLDRREDPGPWWVNQKFSADYSNLNNTLYKAIQENFLDSFFKNRFNNSMNILDIGCGIGYYTKKMGLTGANVLGIDPDVKYIEVAKRTCQKNVSFKVSEIGNLHNLDWIESNSMDFVFMSDALLFYFVSPNPGRKQDINILFSDIKRILKPHGRFFSIEPSGVFWLRPWLGEEERPFTVLTEHNTRRFNVAPNYRELINAFITGGFNVKDFKEMDVNTQFEKTDKRASFFAKEFPLWYFFELEPIK